MDVGGGSTQISLFDKDTLVTTQNLRIGSLRIRERLRNLMKETTHYDQLIAEYIRNELIVFERLYLKDRNIKNVILLGDFLQDIIFREKLTDWIITKKNSMSAMSSLSTRRQIRWPWRWIFRQSMLLWWCL